MSYRERELRTQQQQSRIELALGEGPLLSLFQRLMKQHPPNHNPRPAISATALRNKAMCDPEPIIFVERMVAQHRDKWLPAWQSGRMVPDLHNWIVDYDPDADIGPVESRRPRSAVAEMEGV